MKMKNKNAKRGGIGFIGILTLIFIVLKLANIIHWSWVWILSPIWITSVFCTIIFAIILIVGRIKKGKW